MKDDKVKTATQALRKLQDRSIPILGSMISEASRLKKIKNTLNEVAASQKELIDGYLKNSLTLAVSRILLTRLERLAENYNAFFKNIGLNVLLSAFAAAFMNAETALSNCSKLA